MKLKAFSLFLSVIGVLGLSSCNNTTDEINMDYSKIINSDEEDSLELSDTESSDFEIEDDLEISSEVTYNEDSDTSSEYTTDIQEDTEATSQISDKSSQIEIYKNTLKNILTTHELPLSNCVLENEPYEDNNFSICDVDLDGKEELIVSLDNNSMAGMVSLVYDTDDNGELILELDGFVSKRFYDNGIVAIDASHNQDPVTAMWPYGIYKYNPETDSFYFVCGVSSISLKQVEMMNELAEENGNQTVYEYPYDSDKTNSGVVYYIYNSEDEKTEMDSEEYDQFYTENIGSANEIIPTFNSLSLENIELL